MQVLITIEDLEKLVDEDNIGRRREIFDLITYQNPKQFPNYIRPIEHLISLNITEFRIGRTTYGIEKNISGRNTTYRIFPLDKDYDVYRWKNGIVQNIEVGRWEAFLKAVDRKQNQLPLE